MNQLWMQTIWCSVQAQTNDEDDSQTLCDWFLVVQFGERPTWRPQIVLNKMIKIRQCNDIYSETLWICRRHSKAKSATVNTFILQHSAQSYLILTLSSSFYFPLPPKVKLYLSHGIICVCVCVCVCVTFACPTEPSDPPRWATDIKEHSVSHSAVYCKPARSFSETHLCLSHCFLSTPLTHYQRQYAR